MADQTVRTIYEANVTRAQRNLRDLGRDTDRAADSVDKLDGSLDRAGKRTVKPKIDLDIEKAEKEVRKLTQELDELEKLDADVRVDADVDAARADLGRAEAELKALQGAKAEMVVTVDADDVDLDEMGDAAEDAGDDAGARAGNALLEGLNSTPIVGAITGIVVAAGGYIISGIIGEISEKLRAEDVFGASTGMDEATARKFGAAAGAAYGNAWGESVEQNLDTARRALENGLIDEDATGREIQVVTEQLTALTEIMDVDVTEAAEAAGTMMKNGLAASAEEAFDVILTGSQEGLDRSKDWLDTLREYSPMFESIGLSGAEAGGLIEQAMDAGARNSDVAADALKEFSIRAQDDSKTTREAFELMGLDADEMGQAIAAGGDTAAEGLDTVLDGLREIEDPVQRNLAGVALFGTMWEDMGNGAAVLAMDLDDLGGSWVDVGDTSADAMQRMQDNAATAWEKIKRNVTNAATQALGGIASTFEDPIMDLSAWVSTHTAEILGFLVEVGNGFFDLARAAVEFGAWTIEVLGNVAGSFDGIVRNIGRVVEGLGVVTRNNDMADLGRSIQDGADKMEAFADNSEGAAAMLRNGVGGAIDSAEEKFQSWTGPAIAQASLNDAINAMIGRVDEFSAHVDNAGGTVTINGNELPAEEALNTLISEVDGSDGTVTINGQTVPADQALDVLIDQVNSSDGSITIHGNNAPAKGEAAEAASYADRQHGTIHVGADAASANREINNAARDRWSTIRVSYSVVGGVPQARFGNGMIASGMAHGGRIDGYGGYGSGYGIVPGPSAPYGVDNVLWPTTMQASGTLPGRATGGTLSQPLAGGEWVVNPVSSKQHDSLLAAINAGATRSQIAASLGAGGGAASVDSGAITSAVAAGMRGMTVALNLDGRTLYGAVLDAGKAQRAPFVTRRG